jgi:hypothetical protein
MTPFDWNDDKAIWEDLERAQREAAISMKARKAKAERTTVPDSYLRWAQDEIHELRLENSHLRTQISKRVRENQSGLSKLRPVWLLSIGCLFSAASFARSDVRVAVAARPSYRVLFSVDRCATRRRARGMGQGDRAEPLRFPLSHAGAICR